MLRYLAYSTMYGTANDMAGVRGFEPPTPTLGHMGSAGFDQGEPGMDAGWRSGGQGGRGGRRGGYGCGPAAYGQHAHSQYVNSQYAPSQYGPAHGYDGSRRHDEERDRERARIRETHELMIGMSGSKMQDMREQQLLRAKMKFLFDTGDHHWQKPPCRGRPPSARYYHCRYP